MARNFKMFDHIVNPETMSKGLSFMRYRPLESFLLSSFIYMLWYWFSYRSLFGAYIGLMCFSFVQQYSSYVMEKIFDVFYKNVMDMMIRERNKMVMAHFTKPADIDDGNEAVDEEVVDEEVVDEEVVDEEAVDEEVVDEEVVDEEVVDEEAVDEEEVDEEEVDEEEVDEEVVQSSLGNPFDNLDSWSDQLMEDRGGEEKSKIVESAVEEAVDSFDIVDPVIIDKNNDNYLKLRKRQVPRT